MEQAYFDILAPAHWSVPAVFNSPHSGGYIPPSLIARAQLSRLALLQSQDCFVDELFSGCQQHGIPMLRALASRAYLDLNREPFELDQRMFAENLPGHMNPGSPRVAAGFGTVPRLVIEGQEIYRGKLALAEALSRIEQFYRPYHRTLDTLMNEAHQSTGQVLLIDCHSMPASAVRVAHAPDQAQVDVVVGDRFGASCDRGLACAVHDFFEKRGLRVVRNKPYAGGFITECYGAPQQNRHALQIEINRRLYLNERTQEKHAGFVELRRILTEFAVFVGSLLSEGESAREFRHAAE